MKWLAGWCMLSAGDVCVISVLVRVMVAYVNVKCDVLTR